MSGNTKLIKTKFIDKQLLENFIRQYDKDIFKNYYSTPSYSTPSYFEGSSSTERLPPDLNQTFNKIKSRINVIYHNIGVIIDGISFLLGSCDTMKEIIRDETAVMYLDEIKEVFFDLKKIFKAPDLNYNLLLLLELTKLLDENKELFIKKEFSLSLSYELDNQNSEIFTSRLLDNLKELRKKVREQN